MSRLPAPMSVVATSVLARNASDQSAELEAILDRIPAKQRKLMARSAELATATVHALLAHVPAIDRAGLGLFAGVGASGAKLDELLRLVRVCIDDGVLSYERLGTDGLAACHPLFAFRIMNNFTLSHPAIAEGTRGPNAAFFSRGAATAHALVEAAWSIHEGQCERAIVLGADSATHALTLEELRREGHEIESPGEAAGALIIAPRTAPEASAFVVAASSERLDPGAGMLTSLLDWHARYADSHTTIALIADARLRVAGLEALSAQGRNVVDLVATCGTLLAAGPIVGACLAVERIRNALDSRCTVLSVDWDGTLSYMTFASAGEA